MKKEIVIHLNSFTYTFSFTYKYKVRKNERKIEDFIWKRRLLVVEVDQCRLRRNYIYHCRKLPRLSMRNNLKRKWERIRWREWKRRNDEVKIKDLIIVEWMDGELSLSCFQWIKKKSG